MKTVLVTGATGFLGSHIAYQLLEEGKNVYVVVRGDNAKERIKQIMLQYFNRDISAQLTIVNGDLTKPYLGLSKEAFSALSKNLDAIIYSAADVRHFCDR